MDAIKESEGLDLLHAFLASGARVDLISKVFLPFIVFGFKYFYLCSLF